MKIAIIGAGLSGCAAYLALKKRLPVLESEGEHEYTIYEAYETSATSPQNYDGKTHSASFVVGAGLAIGPNGLGCVKRLDEDIFHNIAKTGYPYAYQQMKSSQGWNLMRMEATGSEPKINSVSLSRHALWRCFRDRVPDDIVVNKRVSAVVANLDGRNVIKFADGSPDAEADLVLGADGLKSITKSALFPEDKKDRYPPHYEGVIGVGGFVPAHELHELMEPGIMNLVFGGNGFFGYCYTNSDENETNRHIPQGVLKPGNSVMWWSTYEIKECPDTKSIDMAVVLKDVKTRHGSWKSPVVQKILAMAEIQNMYPVWTTPPLPTWERHGVVLIGDAAHALPPTSGQGVSQAMEDVECFSMLLAHSLNKAGQSLEESEVQSRKTSISWAAKKFMEIRMPRVKAIIDRTRQFQNKKRDLSLFQEWFMYLMLFIMNFLPAPAWMKEVFSYNIADETRKVFDKEA
ncbi:FAD binding domain-containing protein [Arthroderma uncinatum]|uniref:FAD binding domain-containing protein n=1 Tax=Arthroderma uncinatum TaxID=74035 RepID=UPI00144A7AAD|nr:FAD binding domain-containing protein [Arthroderma uncinatum]KAF3484239.1 FAD binding domain-containing protein [Arthroderma uncinatum]